MDENRPPASAGRRPSNTRHHRFHIPDQRVCHTAEVRKLDSTQSSDHHTSQSCSSDTSRRHRHWPGPNHFAQNHPGSSSIKNHHHKICSTISTTVHGSDANGNQFSTTRRMLRTTTTARTSTGLQGSSRATGNVIHSGIPKSTNQSPDAKST